MESLARLDGKPGTVNLARTLRVALTGAAALGGLAAALPAHANSAAVDYFRSRADRTAVPSLLSQDDRSYYKTLFGAIEKQDWSTVQQMLAQRQDGPLHEIGRAHV